METWPGSQKANECVSAMYNEGYETAEDGYLAV